MSEPISAFAVYKKNGAADKKTTTSRKTVANKKTPVNGKKITTGAKGKTETKKKTTSPKVKKAPVALKRISAANNISQHSPKTKTSVTSQVSNVRKERASNTTKNATKGKAKNDMDKIIDLLATSRTLTAEEKNVKKDFEKLLKNELDHEGSSSCDCCTNSEFSDEYTLSEDSDNITCTGSSSEEDSDVSSESSTQSDYFNPNNNHITSSAELKGIPQKRKESTKLEAINQDCSLSGASLEKKIKQSDLIVRKRRQSLPMTKLSDKNKASEPNCSSSISMEPKSVPLFENYSSTLDIVKANSIEEGLKVFEWLFNPITMENFFSKYWESNACLIKRSQKKYFSHLISFEMIDQMLLNNHVEFTKNIDITSYKKGVRETLNPEGRAMSPAVWDFYEKGCSIRLLNPQTFLKPIYALNVALQEYFRCFVGANVYLTPPNSQGFAPHYDDIEAFVLQVEGKKRWKLYKSRRESELLPRMSSNNFSQQEIGKPILDEVLEAGDLLYFPRGTIHQACTESGSHSLHITLSVYQKNSFSDLFEHLMPILLRRSILSNLDLRRGLPLDTFQQAGIAFSSNDTAERVALQKNVSKLLNVVANNISLNDVIDEAVDQLAKKMQHEALPPLISSSEQCRTVFGTLGKTNERGKYVKDYKIDIRTNIRLLRANILRLVKEEDKVNIYYHLDNSKEYCEYEPNFFEVDPEAAGCIEILVKSYPEYVGVSQFPMKVDNEKIDIAISLWERGLLILEKPIK